MYPRILRTWKVWTLTNKLSFRDDEIGGAHEPSVFLVNRTKIMSPRFHSFEIYAIVHPQLLAPCSIPALGFIQWEKTLWVVRDKFSTSVHCTRKCCNWYSSGKTHHYQNAFLIVALKTFCLGIKHHSMQANAYQRHIWRFSNQNLSATILVRTIFRIFHRLDQKRREKYKMGSVSKITTHS